MNKLTPKEIEQTIAIWNPEVSISDVCVIAGMVCCLERFIFTVGVCFGLKGHYRHGRFCFDTLQNARSFLCRWDGTSYPIVGEDGCTAIKGTLSVSKEDSAKYSSVRENNRVAKPANTKPG